MNRNRWRIAISLVALIVLIAVAKFGSFDKPVAPGSDGLPPAATDAGGGRPSPAGRSESTPVPVSTGRSPYDLSHLAVDASERGQIETTLALIASNGPFPHKRDGIAFNNREGRLPRKPRGYYRDYTVETPGAATRGARRIVRGERGETYYTRDHYATFVRVDEGGSGDR